MSARRVPLHRRDLIRRLRGRPSTTAPSPTATPSAGWFDLIKASRPAMGSFFEIRLPALLPGAVALAEQALDRIDVLESQLTIYRDDSEVSRLNATAHLAPVAVETGLFRLLEQAIAISRETGGAYDVTSGALSIAWGFIRGPKRVPDDTTLADARDRTGFHHLALNAAASSVAFDRPGIVVNFGSIGKGYAIDRAVDVIRGHWWPTPALVHGGQSSLYALGSPPGEIGGRWEISLRNPIDPDRPLGTIRLRDRGLGTSGNTVQRFEADGRTFGHIIDPRSGEPAASGPAGVTVLAPTAAEADALSTAFLLMGPDASGSFLAERPEVGAIFVLDGSKPGSARVAVFNLGEDEFAASDGIECTRIVAPARPSDIQPASTNA